jgi:simple sugar transport system ATP-binding protein
MIGEFPLFPAQQTETPPSTPSGNKSNLRALLSLDDISTSAASGGLALSKLSLDLRAGEIVGIAGVAGNGQTELIEVLLGFRQPTHGIFSIKGSRLHQTSPAQMRALGVALIPQDRHHEGLALSLSVEENLLLNTQRLSTLSPGLFLNPNDTYQFAVSQIDSFGIRTSSPTALVSSLSGGNQQRVVIARELATAPQVIVAVNPTRGLDIGATAYVHRTLRDHCQRDAGVLLISTELDEILALSQRIYALYQGRLVGPVEPTADRKLLGQMMTGVTATS